MCRPCHEEDGADGLQPLHHFVAQLGPAGFHRKEFQFKNSDAMKFTTQHDLYR